MLFLAATLREDVKNVYIALIGDQCAITGIRPNRLE